MYYSFPAPHIRINITDTTHCCQLLICLLLSSQIWLKLLDGKVVFLCLDFLSLTPGPSRHSARRKTWAPSPVHACGGFNICPQILRCFSLQDVELNSSLSPIWAGFSDLLLMNRTWQKWWFVIFEITLWTDYGFSLSLAFSTPWVSCSGGQFMLSFHVLRTLIGPCVEAHVVKTQEDQTELERNEAPWQQSWD